MMPDAELLELGEDIKKNGLREHIKVIGDRLVDGRNRLEAAERVGIKLRAGQVSHLPAVDPVGYVISLNIHRRHLTKQQQADLIVAALAAGKKLTKPQSVSNGGRGKVNPIKQAAIAEGKKHGISEGTMKASLAKANPKPTAPDHEKTKAKRPPRKSAKSKGKPEVPEQRALYLEHVASLDLEALMAEIKAVQDALCELLRERREG
jgi:hypothetical protein